IGPERVAGILQGLGLVAIEHVQRRGAGALANGVFDPADPEREAGVLQGAIGVSVGFAAIHQGHRAHGHAFGFVSGIVVVFVFAVVVGHQGFAVLGHHAHLARHGRHGLARQRDDGGNWRAGDDLAIRQGTGAGCRQAAAQLEGLLVEAVFALFRYGQAGAFLEHVMDAPHAPHALGEVRVEVAVVDGIARGAVAVAGAAVGDFVGIARTRPYALGVDVVGVVVIGV